MVDGELGGYKTGGDWGRDGCGDCGDRLWMMRGMINVMCVVCRFFSAIVMVY